MELSIFIKKLPYESGVAVSVKHLCKELNDSHITYELRNYKDDEELLSMVKNCKSKCINLQVPSFSDETMNNIMNTGKNIVLSIHSTMCNIQTEEGLYARFGRWAKLYPCLRFTCPSKSETDGFNALYGNCFLYLPNTFSYEISSKEISNLISNKCGRTMKEVSLFCAYRPMKNIVTQFAAVKLASQQIPITLHLFTGLKNNPLYQAIRQFSDQPDINVVFHEQMPNYECFKLEKQMDLAMQVSLSETFSYVAFEHMICAIPVVGSSSVSFATIHSDYSNVDIMAENIVEALKNPKHYKDLAIKSLQTAQLIRKKNREDAIHTINEMINR